MSFLNYFSSNEPKDNSYFEKEIFKLLSEIKPYQEPNLVQKKKLDLDLYENNRFNPMFHSEILSLFVAYRNDYINKSLIKKALIYLSTKKKIIQVE